MDPTERFSTRVTNYVKYRPSYPPGLLDLLRLECGLTAGSIIADIGSGTGLLSELFLCNGNQVFGVEPNCEMRVAGERQLESYLNFHSVTGTAEATTLADQSIDFVAAGQAFHWFDQARAKAEFARILKQGGWVVLVWNERVVTTPFLVAYEALLQSFSTDYAEVDHRRIDETVMAAFLPGFRLREFENVQTFDYAGLEGRLLSSSYAPEPGHPNHDPMLAELRRIFAEHQRHGTVDFAYVTRCYYGQLQQR